MAATSEALGQALDDEIENLVEALGPGEDLAAVLRLVDEPIAIEVVERRQLLDDRADARELVIGDLAVDGRRGDHGVDQGLGRGERRGHGLLERLRSD